MSVSLCQGSHGSLAMPMGEGGSNPTLIVLKRMVMTFSPVISISAPTWRVLEALKSEGLIGFRQQLGEVVEF